LTNLKTKVKAALEIYRSGGIWVFICRIFAYFWKQYAWLYIRLTNHKKIVKRIIHGNIMNLSLQDSGISQELAVYKTHEPISMKMLIGEIKPGMRVVDIGANIGYYALTEAKLVGNKGDVIAIEPVPSNVKMLKSNIAANGYNNIRIYEVAIGPENRSAKMYLSNKSNLSAMLPNKESTGNYLTVPMVTLDSLLANEKQIDYIQMDMEGYEVEAIKGMLGILNRYHPGIFMEIHSPQAGGENAVNLLKQLKSLGYRTKYAVDKVFNYPFINSKKSVETPSIDEFIADDRIKEGRAVFNIFLY
jgi:FkbM family methyltransferase